MRRAHLGVGDKAGHAVITEGLPSVTYSNPPPSVHIATLGMKTWCDACKQEGHIAPRGPRWAGTGPNGRQWALSGDINICSCAPPPVFYAERNMEQVFTREEAAAQIASNATETSALIPADILDQHFYLIDEKTRRPLKGVPYRIVTSDGDLYEGCTDAQGRTQRVSNDWDSSAMLQVFEDEMPINPEWDKQL